MREHKHDVDVRLCAHLACLTLHSALCNVQWTPMLIAKHMHVHDILPLSGSEDNSLLPLRRGCGKPVLRRRCKDEFCPRDVLLDLWYVILCGVCEGVHV